MTSDQMVQRMVRWTCPECNESVDVPREFGGVSDEAMMRPCPECRARLCEFCAKGDCVLCGSPACANCGQQVGDLWVCFHCKDVANRLLCAHDNAKAAAERAKALEVADAMKQIVLAGCDQMASRKAFADLGAALCQR